MWVLFLPTLRLTVPLALQSLPGGFGEDSAVSPERGTLGGPCCLAPTPHREKIRGTQGISTARGLRHRPQACSCMGRLAMFLGLHSFQPSPPR